jgi:hypothetical protein
MKHTIPSYHVRIKESTTRSDFFNRKDFSENLTNLFSSTEDSLTITINADWGEGKTTFIKLWEDELNKSENFIPIYYDAFENDFASDAFISIAVTIQEAIENHFKGFYKEQNKKEIIEEYKKTAKKLGIELAKMGANTTIRLTTGGLLQADSLLDFLFKNEKNLNKNENKVLVSEKYDSFLERRKTINEYQKTLEEVLKIDAIEPKKKIIFFVDELDRCRPDFAIQVIEKIKHLFSVSNVNFVLAVNREQLVEIISHAYGVNKEDAYIYLQKFVHVETSLPTLKDLRFSGDENLKSFLNGLVNAFEIPDELFDSDGFYNLISKSLNVIDYNPRSIERTLTLYSVSISSCDPEKAVRLFRHVLLLSLLKIHARPIYEDAKGNQRVLKGIKSRNVAVGMDFIKFLGTENYFGPGETRESANAVKIKNLKEAARIVDIYDLPPKDEKSKQMYQ